MLAVKDLDVAYGYAQVLHDVSFRLEQGHMAFVIGRNGAGKTTLLKTLMGLLRPRRGSIVYQGEEISRVLPEALYARGMRYVAQEKRVFANLTVRENIEIPAYASREPLGQALARVTTIHPKLGSLLDQKAGQLSGGQRQILLVGRALVGEPKLLLIDEPTQGLAAVVIDEVARILRGLKGRVSALIVEQNLAVVRHLADRVYIMKEGRIVREISDPSEIADTRGMEAYL